MVMPRSRIIAPATVTSAPASGLGDRHGAGAAGGQHGAHRGPSGAPCERADRSPSGAETVQQALSGHEHLGPGPSPVLRLSRVSRSQSTPTWRLERPTTLDVCTALRIPGV